MSPHFVRLWSLIIVWWTVALTLADCTTPPRTAMLPALKPYSRAEQAELRAEPKGPETVRWLEDYIGLRDQIRAAAQSRP